MASDAPALGAIQRRLHPRDERVDLALIRLAAARRRHQAPAKLAHGGLPDLRLLVNVVKRQRVERHASGSRLLVVAADAVGVEGPSRLVHTAARARGRLTI